MPILRAIGTSLIAVTAFGLTTSFNYALSGLVNWPLAGVFILGGVAGSALGTRASTALSAEKGKLNTVFAAFVMIVALYMLWKSWGEIRSEEHTSELQSLMRISYAVFCLKKKNKKKNSTIT